MNRKFLITRSALSEAIIVLLAKYPLEKISVRQLCDQADINRSTFYAHYDDIGQLLEEIQQVLFDEHMKFLYEPNADAKEKFEQFLVYLRNNGNVFFTLAKNTKMISNINEVVRNTLKEFFEMHVGAITPAFDPYVNCEIDFLVNGTAYFVGRWLAEGCPYPESYISDSIYNKTIDCIARMQQTRLEFL